MSGPFLCWDVLFLGFCCPLWFLAECDYCLVGNSSGTLLGVASSFWVKWVSKYGELILIAEDGLGVRLGKSPQKTESKVF